MWNGFLDGDVVSGSGKEADLENLNECRSKKEDAKNYEVAEDLDEIELFNVLIVKKDPLQQRCAIHKMRILFQEKLDQQIAQTIIQTVCSILSKSMDDTLCILAGGVLSDLIVQYLNLKPTTGNTYKHKRNLIIITVLTFKPCRNKYK